MIGIVFEEADGTRTFKQYKSLSGAQGAVWRKVGTEPELIKDKPRFGSYAVMGVGGVKAEIDGCTFEELFPPPESRPVASAQVATSGTSRRTNQKVADFPGCQLASEFSAQMQFNMLLAEPKLDGYRLVAIIRGGEVKFCTRAGFDEPYTSNLQHIAEQLLALGFRNCLVDGEVLARDFADTAIVRHVDPDEATKKRLREEVIFHVFDWVDLSTIEMQLIGRKERSVFAWKQSLRREFLERALAPHKLPANVRLVPQFVVRSHAEVAALCEEMLELGYEGLVLKDPHAPYVFERSKNWLKVKPTRTIDLKITRVVEGEGKHKGRLGAIEGLYESGETYSVGTGFTDQMREELWARRDELIGQWMEVKVQDTDVSEARHPVFVRLRPDRS